MNFMFTNISDVMSEQNRHREIQVKSSKVNKKRFDKFYKQTLSWTLLIISIKYFLNDFTIRQESLRGLA